ncbi:unnamed protein product [Rotaria sp. Silwood1]|nr:unnamed protein product [Rotaria sp. Silwood1]CAF1054618.1 unnamed protein product [Rotaria sp. Silwood1]CAF1260553.1 unnamed protein product [Rotaria sp. Silwood1]CAF3423483.1 unnamed protein product [Rotaria sp. Silwood1]CAF3431208.1 unnamed protein product [Rotaria sp. Silwood1]
MYARKDIPTVLPDAVLRCRKLQAAANVELDEMEKTKYRRINNLEWQQQTFQKTINERHKRWRMYDRAFRLKLKRELGADLAAALRLRTKQDEEQKFLFEQQLIEKAIANQKIDEIKKDIEKQTERSTSVIIEHVAKSNSANPKSYQDKVSIKNDSKSAVNGRRGQSATTKMSHSTSIVTDTTKLSPRRPRTSRFDKEFQQDTNPTLGLENNFGSVLFRILSNISATPDLDDDFTIKKRALEARERRFILTKDDRYFNLVKELVPQKLPGEEDSIDSDVEEDQ